MRVPISERFNWTASFDQLRPLTSTIKTHNHGAEDLAPHGPAMIVAPEDGEVYFFCAIRPNNKRKMSEVDVQESPFDMKGHYYFYDIYGGVVILISRDRQRTHVMTHSYRNQIFNLTPAKVVVSESPRDERFPICVEHSFNQPVSVKEGQTICGVGNAGFSTGRHIHWEIHRGTSWTPHEHRIRPREWVNA